MLGTLIYSSALEGYFGDEMNLASKLGEDLVRGKETLLTAPAYNELPAAKRRDFKLTCVTPHSENEFTARTREEIEADAGL